MVKYTIFKSRLPLHIIELFIVAALAMYMIVCSHDRKTDTSSIVFENRLAAASSAYLTSAAHQPVHWQEWGEEAFESAHKLDRPILLDIGAVWCHWCHVMDRESYENEEIAAIINKNFIAIKVDRDERPDIDKRFQTFIQAITGRGGWPLTCFLTPQGKPFYGGTYFPPEDSQGRPGLRTVLANIIQVHNTNRDRVIESSDDLFKQISEYEKARTKTGDLNDAVVQQILNDIENNFDSINGGFGGAPKFPNGGAVELVLALYDQTKKQSLLEIAEITLDKMASGGIYDHIGGGFHRYSVDAVWHIPHFEKMTVVNAELLGNFLHLYHQTGKEKYRDVAEGITGYYLRDMSDRANGGFFAHQDADVSLEDDGDYFTWSKDEIEERLPPDQARVFNVIYGITEMPGEIREAPDRNVLFEVVDRMEAAQSLNLPLREIDDLLESAKTRLRAARYTRTAPFVEKTLFASHNGMMISAFADAYKVLKDLELKDFALKSLDFILDKSYTADKGFAHSFINGKNHIYGLLTDQVRMAYALIDGFELSGKIQYLNTAREVMDLVLLKYEDRVNGGFFDHAAENNASDILSIVHKPFEDIPAASSNAVAIRVLDRLYALTHDPKYHEAAKRTLKAFAGSVQGIGAYTASYGLALHYHLNPPAQIVIVGKADDAHSAELLETARMVYRPGKEVYLFDPGSLDVDKLPEVVRLKMTGSFTEGTSLAFVCIGTACAPPTSDPELLADLIKTFGR